MSNTEEQTIEYEFLEDDQIEEVDGYPEGFRFYIDGSGKVHAIGPHVWDLFLAQGGPDPDWQRVILPGDHFYDE